jgi:hypothetical protein
MKKILFGFVFLFFVFAAEAQKKLRKIDNTAFIPGEKLKFRLHYGFIDAGSGVLEVIPRIDSFGGRPVYHVVGTGRSVGAFDFFFKVRDRYESIIDAEALVPWLFIRRVDEGGFVINENVSFNHFKNSAKAIGKRGSKDFNVESDSLPDNIQDLVSAFYYARTIDFSNAKEGDVFEIIGYLDRETVPLNIKFVGREKVKSKLGHFQCLKFKPLLQEGRIFKEKEDMTVWVSDDLNKIPVRVQTDVLVGSIRMDLIEYSGLANPPALTGRK